MSVYRYIFQRLFSRFCGCYFVVNLFFLINYLGMHLEMVEKNRLDLGSMLLHVLHIILSQTYIIAPLALLLSASFTYIALQTRLELVAFLTQGVSRTTLLKPLIHLCCGLCCLEGAFLYFYDAQNEKMIASASIAGSTKVRKDPIGTLELENGDILLFTTQKEGQENEAYLYTKNQKLYHSEHFDLKDPYFTAQKEYTYTDTGAPEEKIFDLPLLLPLVAQKNPFLDPAKPFYLALIFCIPILIHKIIFPFKRHFFALMALTKTTILYLGSHILVKTLCHLLYKLF